MKVLKGVIEEIKGLNNDGSPQLQDLLWKLICYSPKMPSRLHQQQLLDLAVKEELTVFDEYYTRKELKFKTFKWGNGPVKLLLTHGWGSKAIDFSELINVLLLNKELEIRAFDAPGNGGSEGELSNLILFADAVKQVQQTFGKADILIGHSLGAMANAFVTGESNAFPRLLVSIAPLVNLRENFRTTMASVGISEAIQQNFFKDFEALYGFSADRFVLNKLYPGDGPQKHLLFYEQNDPVSPVVYIESFLKEYPKVVSKRYDDTSHARIIIDQRVIAEIDQFIRENN